MNPIRLEIFRHLFASVAEEMGVVLGRTAYSPNIKERKDYSCAVFDARARMIAQAAHIPVHLGSMPLSVAAAVEAFQFLPGDVVILNDPYRGGTHLPDITLVQPVFISDQLAFFAANRAHHSDIGGMSPGSMPVASEVFQEGLIIPPVKLVEAGKMNETVYNLLLANVRTPEERRGDLSAQLNACATAQKRLVEMAARYGMAELQLYTDGLLDYAERLMRTRLATLPEGEYSYTDYLDDDGFNDTPIAIAVTLRLRGGEIEVDFTGSSPQVAGSLNAVEAVTLSAVAYCMRCLLDRDAPTNEGNFRPIKLRLPPASVVNAHHPAAVSGGNVETSQRIVDAVFGALAQAIPDLIPAASSGSMNNLTFGGVYRGRPFSFYETVAGGAGASPKADGASGIHTHMTNTLNTPVEAMERLFPVRVERYSLRRGSGGRGRHRGGDGIVREVRFLADTQVGVVSERRRFAPYGLCGGGSGARGVNLLLRPNGDSEHLPGKFNRQFTAGEVLRLETPGGGGWGEEE